MTIFRYQARDANGQASEGALDAQSSIDAMNQLRRRGLRVERLESEEVFAELETAPTLQSSLASARDGGESVDVNVQTLASPPTPEIRLGALDLAEFAGRIAGITRSQLPLTPGLRALSEELPSRRLRRGLASLCERLEQGEPLDKALESAGSSIPPHIGRLIVVGVQSGRLGEIMEWFLRHVRRQIDLSRLCRASLFYPAALLAAAIGACLFGLLVIVPSMRQMYQDFGIELPAMTVFLFDSSDFIRSYGLFVLAALVTIACAVPLILWGLGGKPLLHRTLASTPFIGTLFRLSALAGFSELLSIFISAHLPLAEGVRLAGVGSRDADLRVQFDEIANCLEQGQDDTELFRRLANISPHLIHVFHWKDRQASFAESLMASVRIYENQARMQISAGGLLLEPLVIIGVLGGAGYFVVALFFPLIKLLNSLA